MLSLKEKKEIYLKAQKKLLEEMLKEFNEKFKRQYFDKFEFHQFLVRNYKKIENELDQLWNNPKLF